MANARRALTKLYMPSLPPEGTLTFVATPEEAAAVGRIEQKLVSHLGTRVAVLHTPKKGRIVIEYRGNDDLQRVLGLLGIEA